MRIGIPRALLFYEYSPILITFFNKLGAEVILSDTTNKNILHLGTQSSVDDACIPIKIFHGHILSLKDKVDYLFVPRVVGLSKGDYICPKFCGLPEMINNSLTELPVMINTKIDFTKTIKHLNETVIEIGSFITNDKNMILSAFDDALVEYKLYKDNLKVNQETIRPQIMLLGHPYNVYDNFVNMNIVKKLNAHQFSVLTPEMLDEELIMAYAEKYEGKIFWDFARKLIGSSLYLLENKKIAGMIYLSSFGCGIDSIVAEVVERRIRKANIPFMLMTIDEHSGEAGFNTRLEAFTDMIKWRITNENNLSANG